MDQPERNGRGQRASQLLLDTLRGWTTDEVSIGELTRALGDRAYGVVMLLFCLPNCIPAPPGLNSVFGIPLLLYAVQLMRGRAQPWQPEFIAARRFRVARLIGLLEAAQPRLQRVERLCRPRLPGMVTGRAEPLLAAFVVLLSLCIIVPLWGTNFVPAVGAALISIALVEQDGLLAGIGIALGLIGIAVTVFVTSGIVWAVVEAASRAL